MALAQFRHPQANRELHLPQAVVAYLLVRARRRSIGLVVRAEGLSVRAPLQLRLDASAPAAGVLQDSPAALLLGLPAHASAGQLRDAVRLWLMQRAQAHFTQRLDHFAPLLGVQWRSLRLSSAQTRWGSAKSDGSIRLNWRLLHYRPAVIDYVVAHELAHLREMNHSARFWHIVASVVPDHAALRRSLRQEPPPCWGYSGTM